MGTPYCCRSFAYAIVVASAPSITPTRSATVTVRPSARLRATSASVSSAPSKPLVAGRSVARHRDHRAGQVRRSQRLAERDVVDHHLSGCFGREHDAASATRRVDGDAFALARRRDHREVQQRHIEHRARRHVFERDASLAREVDREERAQERRVRGAPAELAGHDRDLHPGGERAVVVTFRAELEPACTTHRVGKSRLTDLVVEVVDRLGTEIVHQGSRRSPQLQLLR